MSDGRIRPHIQETAGVRIVLFKEALTTGWDCPRAEVLISLRGSKDDVTITQLIGRAVRTPLAQRALGDDELNSVRVYLPHFNEESVTRVVTRLRDGEDAIASETNQPTRSVSFATLPFQTTCGRRSKDSRPGLGR